MEDMTGGGGDALAGNDVLQRALSTFCLSTAAR